MLPDLGMDTSGALGKYILMSKMQKHKVNGNSIMSLLAIIYVIVASEECQ